MEPTGGTQGWSLRRAEIYGSEDSSTTPPSEVAEIAHRPGEVTVARREAVAPAGLLPVALPSGTLWHSHHRHAYGDDAGLPSCQEAAGQGGGETGAHPVSIYYGVSADGRSVAEAEVDGITGAMELLAAAVAAGCELAAAHSISDLSSLGFGERPGYRRLTGRARPGPVPGGITAVPAEEDTAELSVASYRRQWGHKTPVTWPVAELTGSRLLGVRRDGLIAGIRRVFGAAGRIDAPGLVAGQRDVAGYRVLLAAGLPQITAGWATVESWGGRP